MTIRARNLEHGLAETAPAVQQTFAEVVLGRPTAKCKHLGICKIENACSNNFLDYTMSSSENRLYGVASLQDGVYFELSFSRSSVSPAVFKKHFSSGFFRMEESYTAGPEFMGKPIYLPKGDHKVRLTNSMISIKFAL